MVAHTLVFSVKQVVSLRAFQVRGADLTSGSRFLIYGLDQFRIWRLKDKKEGFNHARKKLFQMLKTDLKFNVLFMFTSNIMEITQMWHSF